MMIDNKKSKTKKPCEEEIKPWALDNNNIVSLYLENSQQLQLTENNHKI